jgi:hypothetical protein
VAQFGDNEEFVDFAGQATRPDYNHAVPLAPLWPALDPDVLSDNRLRAVAVNTLDCSSWQDARRYAFSLMRLGKIDEVRASLIAAPTSDPFLVNELLLASWDGVVHVFPFWPLDRPARFRDLRAQGAFLVTAECAKGRITSIKIRSCAGNDLHLRSPWRNPVVAASPGHEPTFEHCEGIIRMPTLKGMEYRIADTDKTQ